MPELPEVETARRMLEPVAIGRRIVSVAAVDDPIVLQGVTSRRLVAALRGRVIRRIARRGKHLWFELDRRPWPSWHFGMTGGFSVVRGTASRHRFWKVEMALAGGARLVFHDVRRFGRVRLQQDPEHEPPISLLGHDPLIGLPKAPVLAAALARRRAPLKAVLLDQTLFAGVGNWIADEVLYQACLSPHRLASSLSETEVRTLRTRLHQIVRRAVANGADADRFPRNWLFHYRWGRLKDATSARGEEIVHHTVGGRTTAWCPTRQD